MMKHEWFRNHLLVEVLPRWLQASTEQGLYLPHFDRQWNRQGKEYGTLVSQCRLLYNFAQGYRLTQDRAYLDAVESGGAYLLAHFHDPKNGGWFWSCNLDGEVLDDHKNSYGHAFALFGLAHAYLCSRDPKYLDALLHTWAVVDEHFRDESGGLYWRMSRTFEPVDTTKSQNPVMHMFEALLTAAQVKGAEQLLPEARGLGDFVLDRLVRPDDRRLPEEYDLGWAELTQPPGRLDIGHAFEWAYLASWAVECGLPVAYLDYGNSFLHYGLALGMDWAQGGIYSPASPRGILDGARKGWWEQCEALRALAHYATLRNRADLWEPFNKTFDFVRAHYIDPEHGGWYSSVECNGVLARADKGNEWKLDYHVVGMCVEIMRLSTT